MRNARAKSFENQLFVIRLSIHGSVSSADDCRSKTLLLHHLHDQGHDRRLASASCREVAYTDHRHCGSLRLAQAAVKQKVSKGYDHAIGNGQYAQAETCETRGKPRRFATDKISISVFVQA